MRVSTFQSPGYAGSSSTGIVFTYGVVVVGGTSMPAARRRSTRLSRKNGACSEPSFFSTYSRTYSRDSNHLRASDFDCLMGRVMGPSDCAILPVLSRFDLVSP